MSAATVFLTKGEKLLKNGLSHFKCRNNPQAILEYPFLPFKIRGRSNGRGPGFKIITGRYVSKGRGFL